MAKNYEQMWKELGLDLGAHEGLLGVLTNAYQGIYLSQKSRPKAMDYFDFVVSEVHGLRIEEIYKARKEGRKAVGTFCVYVPEEIVLALDGVCIGLCAGAEVGSEAAEKYVPHNTCALIKAFMGFKLSGLCPYIQCCDLIVGETTCDGKKKAYEILDEITGNVHVMELPNAKREESRRLWLSEVKRFRERMEALVGRKLETAPLQKAARVVNARRKALQRLSRARAASPAPISGLDALLVNQISFYDDPVRFTDKVNALCDELDARIASHTGVAAADAPRILVSGSPMAIPNWKLHAAIEGSGGVVVGEESCVGERNHRDLLDEGFSTVDEALEKIASRYLSIDCACFTPNEERLENVKSLVGRLRANGVIHYALLFCAPYMMEAYKVEKALGNVPFMRVETDYSMADMEQLKTRAQAFLEMLTAMNRA